MTSAAPQLSTADRMDILDLYSRQSQLIDTGDSAGWAATFTREAMFVSPTYNLTARGTAQLDEFAQSSNVAALERGEQLRHHITGVVVTATGPDSADSSAYLMITATSSESTRVDRSVVLRDRLMRVEGQWLFSFRETIRD